MALSVLRSTFLSRATPPRGLLSPSIRAAADEFAMHPWLKFFENANWQLHFEHRGRCGGCFAIFQGISGAHMRVWPWPRPIERKERTVADVHVYINRPAQKEGTDLEDD